jgi:enoyl-CoA hydratase/carnithine racemase
VVNVSATDGVVSIILNRPDRRNALTPEMWAELGAAFTAAAESAECRVITLTGAGKSFCAGGDLQTLAALAQETDPDCADRKILANMRVIEQCVAAIRNAPQPTIVGVHGAVIGGGWNLALACDLVLADRTAYFAQSFIEVGLAVDVGGSWLLPQLVGVQRAKDLVFSGRRIDAIEALALGLVNDVVAEGELAAVIDARGRDLASKPTAALRASKRLIDAGIAGSLDEAMLREAQAQLCCFRSAETRAVLAEHGLAKPT